MQDMEIEAMEAQTYIMDLLAEHKLATPNVYKAMNAIDDIIIEHRHMKERIKESDQRRKRKGETK
jgi:hypothetical protein